MQPSPTPTHPTSDDAEGPRNRCCKLARFMLSLLLDSWTASPKPTPYTRIFSPPPFFVTTLCYGQTIVPFLTTDQDFQPHAGPSVLCSPGAHCDHRSSQLCQCPSKVDILSPSSTPSLSHTPSMTVACIDSQLTLIYLCPSQSSCAHVKLEVSRTH